jgi:DNA-binding FadR family transcriptional regulator
LASQNILFVQSLDLLSTHMYAAMHLARSMSLTHSRERLVTVQDEHRMIARAIRSGDPETARTQMRREVANARARVLGNPEAETVAAD